MKICRVIKNVNYVNDIFYFTVLFGEWALQAWRANSLPINCSPHLRGLLLLCLIANEQKALNLNIELDWGIFSSGSVRKFFRKVLGHYIVCPVYISIYFLSCRSFVNSSFNSSSRKFMFSLIFRTELWNKVIVNKACLWGIALLPKYDFYPFSSALVSYHPKKFLMRNLYKFPVVLSSHLYFLLLIFIVAYNYFWTSALVKKICDKLGNHMHLVWELVFPLCPKTVEP